MKSHALWISRLLWITGYLNAPSSPSSSTPSQSTLGGTQCLVLAYLDRHNGGWRAAGDLGVPGKKSIPRDSILSRSHSYSRGAILAVTLLALLLAGYITGSLVWEDFTYYDNSHFTNGTLVGKDMPVQIVPNDGRFFPLGHQEFNLIRHVTSSVTGYHALRIVQLVLSCGILLIFDEELSIQARVALIILVLITPSILISFSGLIYPEWNVVFWLVCLAFSVKRFEQTQSNAWAVAAVISSQFMLYYKETAFLLLLSFAVGRLLLRCWKTDQAGWDFNRLRDPESRLDMCLAFLGVWFFIYYLAAMFPNYSFGYADEFQLPMKQILSSYFRLDLLVWTLVAVVLARIVQILRRKVAPVLLWDGLAELDHLQAIFGNFAILFALKSCVSIAEL